MFKEVIADVLKVEPPEKGGLSKTETRSTLAQAKTALVQRVVRLLGFLAFVKYPIDRPRQF